MHSFTLNIKPFSVNQMFTLRNYKTVAYRDWEELFLHEMAKPEAQHVLRQVREAMDLSMGALCIRLTFYMPKNVLFTADGKMSGRAYDLSNIEKPILDLICLPKVNAFTGVPNLNLDDKYVVSLVSKKRLSVDDKFSIKISLRPVKSEFRP